MKAVVDAGWPVVWSGGEGFGVRFAYVEPPNSPATIIEISDSPMRKRPARSSSATPRRIGTAPTRSAKWAVNAGRVPVMSLVCSRL